MSLQQYEEILFKKQQKIINPQLNPLINQSHSPFQQLLAHSIYFRLLISSQISNYKETNYHAITDLTRQYTQKIKGIKVNVSLLEILQISNDFFMFQMMNNNEWNVVQQKKIIKSLQNIKSIIEMYNNKSLWNQIKASLNFSSWLIQCHLKRILIYKKVVKFQLIDILMKITQQLNEKYPKAITYYKKFYTILCHLKIYNLNLYANKDDRIIQIGKIIIDDFQKQQNKKLLNLNTKIILLYNYLKNIIGNCSFIVSNSSFMNKVYQALNFKSINAIEEHLLQLFFIIKGLIYQKGQNIEKGHNEDQQYDIENINDNFSQKFECWQSINLEETTLALDQVVRSIINHRVASLATLIGMKLKLSQFCLHFLQVMHDGPFNNDAQTIKLCFQLFQARQFDKLHNSLQVVLSTASSKRLAERQVLLSMCSIFTGLYLQNREQALMYAKLNHSENKKSILRQETLLQQVGFAYYSLAIHEQYLCNRQIFLKNAKKFLLQSIEINPHNYLVHYCLAKVYLMQFDYDNAYKNAMQSCKSGRSQWIPFSLLACIYFCQRRITKSTMIIDELMKKYPNIKLLYYIRAYLQTNKILLDVEYDEQVEAAKELGDNIYQLCHDRILKTKQFNSLILYCQQYHQIAIGVNFTQPSLDYFTNQHCISFEQSYGQNLSQGLGYHEVKGQQAILQIIALFLQVGLVDICDKLIKNLPASPMKNFYKAVLHEYKNQKDQAICQYKFILNQHPYHTPTLINLATIGEDSSQILHYIDLVEKFVQNGKVWLAKGMILSRLGRIEQANQLFLRQGQHGWLEYQPDLLYYY